MQRKWTLEQKRRIIDEIARARMQEETQQSILENYNITRQHILVWKKQLGRLQQE